MNDIVYDLQDLRYLNWTRTRKSSGTAGSFLKSYDDAGKKKKYYKLSDFEPAQGAIGHECINEIVVQRLLRLLQFEHLEYRLLHAMIRVEENDYETYLCESEDFKSETEGKVALEDYYLIEKEPGETPVAFFRRMGWENDAYALLLTDYLVLNRDRHGANMEVLRDSKSKKIRLSPLFDHGLSLLYTCHSEKEFQAFDVTEDRKVQSFLGTSSTLENVKMVPNSFLKRLPKLAENDLTPIFEGLNELVSETHLAKMHNMIWERWCSLGRI